MRKLFINLTNHPSVNWDKKQQDAAREYGEIMDLAFPRVPAEADEEYIVALAGDFYHQIMEICANRPENATVLLQGEFTFVYHLTYLLRQAGMRVLSACTERDVVEKKNPDGSQTKTAVFRFVRYREYL